MTSVIKSVLLTALLSSLLLTQGATRGQESDASPSDAKDERLASILTRVGESVGHYQAGLFSMAFTETMKREGLDKKLRPKGRPKEYVFDDLLLRQTSPGGREGVYAIAARRVKTIDGKPGKQLKEGAFTCGEPNASYSDHLSFLLPKLQGDKLFSYEGETEMRGRKVFLIGALPRVRLEPEAVWKDNCFYVNGEHRLKIWVDAENFDVLRLDAQLIESVEFKSPRTFNAGFARIGPKRKLRLARSDITLLFRRVEFKEPAQTLLLPESAESLTIIEGAGHPRVRVTQTFGDYRRYVSDVKVIEDAEPSN
jgi:hypothetical protein